MGGTAFLPAPLFFCTDSVFEAIGLHFA